MNVKDNPWYAYWVKYGFPYPSAPRDRARYRAWQARASLIIGSSIRNGVLVKAKDSGLLCVDCGVKAECWEHRDYGKPLDVVACCNTCNMRRGKAICPDHFPDPTHHQLMMLRSTFMIIEMDAARDERKKRRLRESLELS